MAQPFGPFGQPLPPGGGAPPQGYAQQPQQPQAYQQPQGQALPHGAAPGQPGVAPGQAAPAAPRKGRAKGLLIALGAVVAVLLIAGGVTAFLLMRDGGEPTMLLEWHELPEGTDVAGKMPLRLAAVTPYTPDSLVYNDSFALGHREAMASVRAAELPDEALWSYLGHIVCGGEDVYARLMLGHDSEFYAASAGAKPSREALQCGKQVAESLQSQNAYLSSTADEVGDVWLLAATLEKLPATPPIFKPARKTIPTGTTTANPPGWTMHCKFEELKVWCEDLAWTAAKAEDRDLWAVGFFQTVKAFAVEQFDQRRKLEKEDPDPEEIQVEYALLKELVTAFQSYDLWSARVESPDDSIYDGMDTPINSFAHIKTTDEAQSEAIQKHLDDIKAWAYGEKHEEEKISMRLEYRLSDESAAKGFGAALVQYRNKLKARVDAGKADDEDIYLKDYPKQAKEALVATRKARQRAVAAAKVAVNGKAVALTLVAKPNAAEQKAIDAYYAWRKPHSAAAVRIINAVLAGKEASDGDLEILGGKDLVKQVHKVRKEKDEK